MPFSANSTSDRLSGAASRSKTVMSRNDIIEIGLKRLNDLGSHHICHVCISNSGSCCRNCVHLRDGLGCQKRNTSCTAWLCGFHKYFMYEMNFLDDWNAFWDQIPGQDYREDYTPELVSVTQPLPQADPAIARLGEALAADLQEIERSNIAIGFILTLREKLDKYMDQLLHSRLDYKKQLRLQRKIKSLTIGFSRFHRELNQYRETLADQGT